MGKTTSIKPEQKHNSKHDFPAWAPAEVVARYHEEVRAAQERISRYDELVKESNLSPVALKLAARDGAESDKFEKRVSKLLFKLLTHENMCPVWEFLSKAGHYTPRGGAGVPHTSIYASCVVRAWMGPFGEETWTQAKRAQWIADVADLAEKLAERLDGTGADEFLLRRYLVEKHRFQIGQAWAAGLSGEPLPTTSGQFEWHPGLVSELLRSVGMRAEEYLRPSRLVRPKDPQARRAYFVRSLVEWCLKGLGGPCVSIVTPTAAVALEDETITERQVYRLIENGSNARRRQ